MPKTRNNYVKTAAVLGIILAIAVGALAKTHSNTAFPNIKIKNFGQMDERFFRGAQPKEEDYKDLAALGIKTVVDLRQDTASYAKGAVEALGMRYVNIAIVDKKDPSDEQVQSFLNLVNDPSTGKFFVHCAGGRHRTGVIGAIYRFNVSHWNYDQVYAEMKDYDFYSSWGHGGQKKYVENYWAKIQANGNAAAAAATSTKQ